MFLNFANSYSFYILKVMNVQKYLERIKYDGNLNRDSTTLEKLCDCHTRNVPFDTLDMFGGPRKILNLEKIYQDIVVKNKGGFCYENNGLFHWLLTELGYKVKIIQGQVYVQATKSFNPDFDHMAMLVECDDGKVWLTDVGFFASFVTPLQFVEMTEQSQRNGAYRIRKYEEEKDSYVVEKVKKIVINGMECEGKNYTKSWKIMFKFDVIGRIFMDFQQMFDYQQDSENSFLKYNSICSLQTKEGIVMTWGLTVCRRRYIDPYTEEVVSVETAKNVEEFKKIIKDLMGIELNFKFVPQSRDYTGFKEDQGSCDKNEMIN